MGFMVLSFLWVLCFVVFIGFMFCRFYGFYGFVIFYGFYCFVVFMGFGISMMVECVETVDAHMSGNVVCMRVTLVRLPLP